MGGELTDNHKSLLRAVKVEMDKMKKAAPADECKLTHEELMQDISALPDD